MLSNQVYGSLDVLNHGRGPTLDRCQVQFLQGKGLVSILSSSDYSARSADVARLDYVKLVGDLHRI